MTSRARGVLALALVLAACTPDPVTLRSTAPSPVDTTAPTVTISPPVAPAGEADPDEPTRTRFAGRIVSPLPGRLAREMRGETWEPGCPVPLEDLALLRFNHHDFDGRIQRGPMVVHASVAEDVLGVFRTLFRAGFPIERVALAERYRPSADPNTRRSVTASFNCRPIVTPSGPGDRFSMHAYGLAVDVNSLQNPYVSAEGFTPNRFARPYRDRTLDLPGMIHDGDAVVRAFASIGWEWGGHWGGGTDYMHFSINGR